MRRKIAKPLSLALSLVVVAAVVVFAGALAAAAAEEPSLIPLPTLPRPIPDADRPGLPPLVSSCSSKPLPPIANQLPFGPGELLGFDIALFGMRTGKVALSVDARTDIDGENVFPVHGQVTTDGFLTILGELDARMVTFLDAHDMKPVRMANRVVVRQAFGQGTSVVREDGAFNSARVGKDGETGGEVVARVERTIDGKTSARRSRLATRDDVVDALSVVYYLRSRQLEEGAPFCFELYHRRRLWRVDGKVGKSEVVTAPFGARRAIRLDAVVSRPGKDSPPPRPVTAWITADAARLPLLVQTPDRIGNVEVRLVTAVPGHRLVEGNKPPPSR